MVLQSRINQYFGVNAHLQSVYQAEGGWAGFHNKHVGDIGGAISQRLPAGYIVDTEQSLQIREIVPDHNPRIRRPEPDLTIYATSSVTSRKENELSGNTATITQPIAETLDWDEDAYYTALVIYQVVEDRMPGLPVTWIELLSPSNKQGEGYLQYREKRFLTLKSGLSLVEIDYLHETPSPVKGLPQYPYEALSYPYKITVSHPVPSLRDGTAITYNFAVDEAIPTIRIPLLKGDSLILDVNSVYQHTYTSINSYSYRVDYEKTPLNMERYSVEDQERIARRMHIVQQKAQMGIDLEAGPFEG
jgi:hypothetical protein